MKIIDTHIHIFEKPYSDIFVNSHIKDGAEGEPSLYPQYMRKYNIESAFVIGYEDETYPENNSFVLELSRQDGWDWMVPFGFTRPGPDVMPLKIKALDELGFFGAVCFLDRHDEADWLDSAAMDETWAYMSERSIPISLNLSAFQCAPFLRLLRRHPDLTLLISHMARPRVVNGRLDEKDYAPLLALSEFPNCYVKLSGFYAFVEDGWRYPQKELFCAVDRLREAFGPEKLLMATDFPPVTEFNTFAQALEVLRREYELPAGELEKIYYSNARRIIEKRTEIMTQQK